jgi:hypothetical protein
MILTKLNTDYLLILTVHIQLFGPMFPPVLLITPFPSQAGRPRLPLRMRLRLARASLPPNLRRVAGRRTEMERIEEETQDLVFGQFRTGEAGQREMGVFGVWLKSIRGQADDQ